jgi:hypothetical protein
MCSGPDIDAFAWQEVECPPVPTTYQRFAAACAAGISGEPTFRRAAEIQRLIDLCFAQSAAEAAAAEAILIPEPVAAPPPPAELPVMPILAIPAAAGEPAVVLTEAPAGETRH